MDRAILESQLALLETQLMTLVPGSPAALTVQAQILTVQNELEYEPIVPPIFGPHPWHGGDWDRGEHGEHGGPRPGPHPGRGR